MMQYRDRRKTAPKRGWILAGVFVVLIILWLTPLGRFASAAVYTISSPLLRAGSSTSTTFGTWYQTVFHSKAALVTENTDLENQLHTMSVQLAERNALVAENDKLRELLGRPIESAVKVTARVLAGPSKTPYDTLIIDAGATAGVEVGDRVAYGETAIIGEVSEVYATSAKVILYSAPDKTMDVFVGNDHVQATAEGRGSGNFSIQIPRGVDVAVGDPIFIPDTNIRLAGTIERIDDDPNNPFKTLLFKSPVNLYQIAWVDVLKKD